MLPQLLKGPRLPAPPAHWDDPMNRHHGCSQGARRRCELEGQVPTSGHIIFMGLDLSGGIQGGPGVEDGQRRTSGHTVKTLPGPSQGQEGREKPQDTPELPSALNLRAQREFREIQAPLRHAFAAPLRCLFPALDLSLNQIHQATLQL